MAKTIICPSCGFKNSAPGRCVSCGSKMEALGASARTREEEMDYAVERGIRREPHHGRRALLGRGAPHPPCSAPSGAAS